MASGLRILGFMGLGGQDVQGCRDWIDRPMALQQGGGGKIYRRWG